MKTMKIIILIASFLIIISICAWFVYFMLSQKLIYIYYNGKEDSEDNNTREVLSKYQDHIFNEEVNLWHSTEYNHTRDVNRLLHQRQWMKYISDNLPSGYPPKKLLIYYKNENDPSNPKSTVCPDVDLSRFCTFRKIKCGENTDISKYEAVVSWENCLENSEFLWDNVTKIIPHVYVTLESPTSPFYPPVDLSVNNKIFVNYLGNSDIPIPYWRWIAKADQSQVLLKNYAKGRNKLIAMFVSNCFDGNGRLDYAKELQKYVDVDIYGTCGNLKCSRVDIQKCFSMLKKDYKFLLAFENSNCREYITEKMHTNAFQNDVVPIVMGAHPDDYKSLAPAHSYIHVEDFKTPKDLANYLNILDKNDTLYNEYFLWKGTGQFVDTYLQNIYCRICAMVIYNDFIPQPKWPKGSSSKNSSLCLQNKVWYWERSII